MKKSLLLLLFLAVCSLACPAYAADEQQVIEIQTDKVKFLYTDTEGNQLKEFIVTAGKPVLIKFKNTTSSTTQPHNLIICKQDKKGAVTAAAQAMMTDPYAIDKGYIPDSDGILIHSKLLQPGESEELKFTAPAEPGDYPYLCSFPGHWTLMNGIMKVVAK